MTPYPKLFNLYVKMTAKQLLNIINCDNVLLCVSKNITLESFIVLKYVFICFTINQ